MRPEPSSCVADLRSAAHSASCVLLLKACWTCAFFALPPVPQPCPGPLPPAFCCHLPSRPRPALPAACCLLPAPCAACCLLPAALTPLLQGFCKCHPGWYGSDCSRRRVGHPPDQGAGGYQRG